MKIFVLFYRSYTSRDRSLSKERDRSWDSRSGSRNRLGRGGRSASQERFTTRDRSTSRDRGRPGSAGSGYKMAPVSAAGNFFQHVNQFQIFNVIGVCRTPMWSIRPFYTSPQSFVTILENLCVTEKTSQKLHHIHGDRCLQTALFYE